MKKKNNVFSRKKRYIRIMRAHCNGLRLFIQRKSETRFERFAKDDNITAVQVSILT